MTPSNHPHDANFFSAPFPADLPLIELQTIPIRALFEDNEQTAKNIFDILCTEGFFHLDLTGDADGEDFIQQSLILRDAAEEIFVNTPLSEKLKWKGDPLKGVLDKGYRAMGPDENGEPKVAEVLNVPSSDLLNDPAFELLPWLEKYRSTYQSFARHGIRIGHAIMANLERQLHLQPGDLTALHDPSLTQGGFVRMLRYLTPTRPDPQNRPVGPVHTDGNSMTFLFKWSGGFQIARPKTAQDRVVRMIDTDHADAEWLWVKPVPGCVLVNLGDPMPVLTNGLLTSGRHRVMTAPGQQAAFDAYSVLTGLRPRDNTPMKPLKSDIIPPETEDQLRQPTRTALDNAIRKVAAIYSKTDELIQPKATN